jgi:biotin-dependent carboxylase-like uncharacterized protein
VNAALEIIDAGAAVSIQDAGRSGHRAIGVPLAGAADPILLACANALLAQAQDLAALEVALLGPTVRALDAALRVAWAGDFAPRLTRDDGSTQVLDSWRSLTLRPGEVLAFGPCRSGIGYVALAGGCDVPAVLGSRSTYARAGLGGIQGRAPRAGDRLACSAPVGPERQFERQAAQPFKHVAGALRVLPGPQHAHFDSHAWAQLVGGEYLVSRDADRMGQRLQGPALRHLAERGADIVSEGVVPGAVQVPGAGQPIVLGVDAQTIGGYAKIATLIRADLPRLAHARPGSVWRFRWVTRGEALAARLSLAAALADWVRCIGPLRAGGEPDAAALHTGNLISGMIDVGPHAPDTLPWE